MTLITRITRLFKADVHGILDTIEDPRSVLRQAIRDMESAIRQDHARLQAFKQRSQAQAIRLKEAFTQQNDLTEKIGLCFEAKDHSLAKLLIRKKLEASRTISSVEQERETIAQRTTDLEERIRTHKELLEEARTNLELYSHDETSNHSTCTFPTRSAHSISEEDIEVAFLEEKKQFEITAGMTD